MRGHSLVSFDVIEKAVNGDYLAIEEILNHYDSYISTLSLQTFIDEQGNHKTVIDEDIKSQLQAKLTAKIFLFRIHDEQLSGE